jgi:benzodiazapine receptor
MHPSFNPPGWIFGPVWTTLYILMGISLYLVLIKPDSALRTTAIRVFFLQLTLNFLWSFFFFYFRNIGLALVDILLMWGSIVWMIMLFRRIHPAAGYMNIPYLLWVSFATALNGAYLFLN